MRVLSFGGGVQTTALAVLWMRGEVDADVAIFADTLGETPETYAHIDRLRQDLDRAGRRLVRVVSSLGALEEHAIADKFSPIPSFTPGAGQSKRECTSNWKIRPIRRWLRDQGVRRATMLIGISIDEVHRMRDPNVQWITNEYPLIDRRLTRANCVEIASAAGYVNTPKSACFFCPYQAPGRWARLAVDHPELFIRAEAIESATGRHLTRRGPIRSVAAASAYLPGMAPGDGDGSGDECEGVCFV